MTLSKCLAGWGRRHLLNRCPQPERKFRCARLGCQLALPAALPVRTAPLAFPPYLVTSLTNPRTHDAFLHTCSHFLPLPVRPAMCGAPGARRRPSIASPSPPREWAPRTRLPHRTQQYLHRTACLHLRLSVEYLRQPMPAAKPVSRSVSLARNADALLVR